MPSDLPRTSVAETLAAKSVALQPGGVPAATTRKCEDLLIDVVGLCVTARNEDYVRSAIKACDDDGPCTAIGHSRTLNAAGAAFVNGTAAHGEDFDDTFEGGPVHAGAVIVPAVLAACEKHNPDGRMALIGIAVGTETLCRLSLVVPKAVHKAGFHPTAIFGAMGAAAGVRAALGLSARQIVDALGIAGSMAGGIIEYLSEGAWPDAASGLRTSPRSSARWRKGRCTGCGSRSTTRSARATAMPPNSRRRICSRPVLSMAASGSARSRRWRSATPKCSHLPPK